MDAKISGRLRLQQRYNFLGGDPSIEVDVQHPLYHLSHRQRHHYPRVIVPAQHLVQMRVHTSLLCDDFREKPALDRKETLFLEMAALLARDQQGQAHPERHADDYLQ